MPEPIKPSNATTSKRVTVTLRPSDLERIERIASLTGQAPNEVIRHAIATEDFLVASRQKDEKLLVEGADGVRAIEFLY